MKDKELKEIENMAHELEPADIAITLLTLIAEIRKLQSQLEKARATNQPKHKIFVVWGTTPTEMKSSSPLKDRISAERYVQKAKSQGKHIWGIYEVKSQQEALSRAVSDRLR